jgi:hypothetical protein
MDHPPAAQARLNDRGTPLAMSLVLEQSESDAAADTAAVGAIRRMLAGIRREARKWIWVESLGWLAIAAAAAFWATLAFDWSVEPPGWVRGMAVVVALAGLGWIVATKLVARLAAPLADESLAIAVERGHPGFGDSLSTTIALAAGDRADVDRRLVARTAAEAAALLDDVDGARIFRRRRLVSLALLAGAAAATVGGLLAIRPDVGLTWARRMLWLSAEPWPRLVSLDAEGFRDGVRTVARGSDVELVVHARGSDGPPAEVDLRIRTATGWTTARMGTRGAMVAGTQTFVHVVKAVGADVDLEIRGGDARLRNLRLRAVDPPVVESFAIRCLLPAYLGGGTRELPAARTIPVPRGAQVAIDCTATKPLRSARLSTRSAVEAGSGSGAAAGPAPETTVAMIDPAAPGSRAISGTLAEILADTAVFVRFVDVDGLMNREGVAFTLAAVPDEPPRVGLRLAGGPTAITPQGRLMVSGTIGDDHGLAAAAVLLRAAGPASRPPATGARGADGEPAPAAAPVTGPAAAQVAVPIGLVRGGETVLEIDARDPLTVPLAPLRLVTGGRLLVSAEARDACTLAGGPNVGTSDTWTLDVVTPDELRALLETREILLRRRFEAAIDDLARARERLAAIAGAAVGAGGVEQTGDVVAQCGEAATRGAGETAEIGAAFQGIGLELSNNDLLSADLEARIVAGIARPLAEIGSRDLPDVAKACRQVAGGPAADPEAVGRRADAAIARMREVLAKMMEAESVNEIVERLRNLLRTQEAIRAETIEIQKRQAREALERP